MVNLLAVKLISILLVSLSGLDNGDKHYNVVPIYFSEYDVIILEPSKYGDTLSYNKSNRENFKLVFYDNKGKCYFERYLDKKLYEKGNYVNSIDTLKRYVSGRSSNGKRSPIRVEEYFQPLKDGEWFIYKGGKKTKITYIMGILQ